MVSMNEMAEIVLSFENKELPIHHIPGPEGVRGRNSDNTLIKEKLGWAPTMKLRVGNGLYVKIMIFPLNLLIAFNHNTQKYIDCYLKERYPSFGATGISVRSLLLSKRLTECINFVGWLENHILLDQRTD